MALSLPKLSTPPADTTSLEVMTRDPNRRVRFVLDGYASPVSTSSTLSSPGPRTPQDVHQSLALVRQPSSASSPSFSPNRLPVLMLSNPQIHDALVVPTFDYNVSFDPATNPLMCDNVQLRSILNDAATTPPSSSVTLISRQLPWEITIRPSSSKSYVTISDIIGGLYRALRLGASRMEFEKQSPEKMNDISSAYYNRFERHLSNPEFMEQEKQKGVKRVDFLAGAHRFRGLSKTDRPDVWSMRFKR